jgi:hypothetical protein
MMDPVKHQMIADPSATLASLVPVLGLLHLYQSCGSGSVSQSYGSGSFCYQAKIVRKPLIPTVL